ncbi:MAG: hypothetical protein Q9218_004292 [Villophora microphyllina]
MEMDIAIIGMACRVAGANSPTELWENLLSSKDVQRRITRFNIDGFYHPKGGPLKGLTNVDRAYMLDDDTVDKFDHAFFHTNPAEAPAMDPQQRMLLEVSYEAIENAGIPLESFSGTDTAVFTGMSSPGIEGSDYHTVVARDLDVTPKYIVTGTAGCMAANRLSYFYDLSGPSASIDTACSSSMAALHQAVRTLQHGDSAMALVCGTNLIFNPESFVSMAELGFLSASGRCRSFDAAGDGYGRGEGIATLVLKPLKVALADSDTIRAVLKGTRLNQDGRTQGITLPSTKAQTQNMNRLYEELALKPSTIQYLEAHGTGTAAGDPLELRAVNALYHANPLIIGSVKGNTGHCEAASALIGLIKTVLCLEHCQIPTQMHFTNPNPAIDFTNITVPKSTLQWPDTRGGARRAAINTFGAGGTNGHAVLEAHTRSPGRLCIAGRPRLFKISGADKLSLQALNESYAQWLGLHRPNLRDLAHTLTARRSTLRFSRFIVASSHDSLRSQLLLDSSSVVTKSSSSPNRTLFVFTGQGAQWARMGCALIEHSPLFKSVIQECDEVLKGLPGGPPWSVIDELKKTKGDSNVNHAEYSQPLCTTLQVGLVSLLRSWGIRPDAVVGHSSGEIGAAFAAGLISLRTAILTAYYRGHVLSSMNMLAQNERQGAMCAVGLCEIESRALLMDYDGKVQLAAVNSPCSCTISGDQNAIRRVHDVCASKGQFCRLLKVDRGKILQNEELTPSYWARNMTSTVLFAGAIQECLESNLDINNMVEIGPHPALKGPVQEILREQGKDDFHYFSTCRRDTNDFESMLHSVGEMIAAGAPLDASAINATDVCKNGTWGLEYGEVLIDLPSYKWNHATSFWSESRVSKNMRLRAHPRHELLGSRYTDDIPSRACWRNHLDPSVIGWLTEFKGRDVPGLSPAVCLLMASEAARQTWTAQLEDDSAVCFTNVTFHDAVLRPVEKNLLEPVDIHFISRVDEASPRMSFEVFRTKLGEADQWVLCTSGQVELTAPIASVKYQKGQGAQSSQLLLQQAQSLYGDFFLDIGELQINPRAISGKAAHRSPIIQSYPIHPSALASILSLGPMPLVGTNLPAQFRISSMLVLKMPITNKSAVAPEFVISAHGNRTGGTQCNVQVRQGESLVLDGNVGYSTIELIPPQAITSSLFFKPVYQPDISKQCELGNIDFKELIQQVTHKWPMIDIRLENIPQSPQERILDILGARRKDRKQRFRSIQVRGESDCAILGHSIRTVKEFSTDIPAHITFATSAKSLDATHRGLRPSGMVCVCATRESYQEELMKHFDRLCAVTGVDEQAWTLWRLKSSGSSLSPKHERIIFGGQTIDFKHSRLVELEPLVVEAFIAQPCHERFDAIVVDDLEKSIISSWPGKHLIPWLQYLLSHAESLLWVTLDASSTPFVGLAGNLLRTLQAEQPSLKVSWLCLDPTQSSQDLLKVGIENAYQAMLRGDNEVKSQVDQRGAQIIRYLPDEGLSAATGVSLPRLVSDSVGDRDYALSMAMPGEPVILSYDSSATVLSSPRCTPCSGENKRGTSNNFEDDLDDHVVKVSVKASIITSDDVAAYKGHRKDLVISDSSSCGEKQTLGVFFAGTVLTSSSPSFAEGSSVVGWAYGAHTNTLSVPAQNLYEAHDDNHSCNVSDLATYAVAVAALDGYIRVREDDVIYLENFDKNMCKAFDISCFILGVPGLGYNPSSQGRCGGLSFTLEVGKNHGLFVNNEPIDVPRYLSSNPLAMRKVWSERRPLRFSFDKPFKDYRDHLKDTKCGPEPRVLIHGDVEGMAHVPIYQKPADIVSSEGAHIIIGGLGGLGRYVCSWLVEHGATTIYAISRSGISSPEAQEMHNTFNSTPGISFEVIKADACNHAAMSTVLSDIRFKHPIAGIINMAMILGDVPMASMTGEEWDRALRVKIDSSWIMHELTEADELDYFVLFSSIASVLGNRNQGGYNLGNTFLNALATWRRKQGKTGVAIALGAMSESPQFPSSLSFLPRPAPSETGKHPLLTLLLFLQADIGVLTTLPTLAPSTTNHNLTRSGLTHLTTTHLDKILEAAMYKSRQQRLGKETLPEEAVMVTGLEMFERDKEGALVGRKGGVYWMDFPEFSHLGSYASPFADNTSAGNGKKMALKEKIVELLDGDGGVRLKGKLERVLEEEFLAFLEGLLGFKKEDFVKGMGLGTYGMDSLGAVAVQFWCFKEAGIDVAVREIFAAKSLGAFLALVREKIVQRWGKDRERGDGRVEVGKGSEDRNM